MTENDARELLATVAAIAASLRRLEFTLCGPRPTKPTGAPVPARNLVTVIQKGRSAHEEDNSDLPPSGGTPPSEFWKRKS